ncbi:unnamed protein product, partial [Ranitomeya imitator]
MESLRSVISSLEKGEFLASINIKDAYLHITIFPPHRRFLRFAVREGYFQFTALPFGLATGFYGDVTPGPVPDFVSKEIQKLHQQNSELREVIDQMRKEMESLCDQISPAPPEGTEPPPGNTTENVVTAEYVRSLEAEIRDLKQKKNRLSEEKLQEALSPKENSMLPSKAKAVSPDNVYIQNHISSLNETIGALRADKVASAASQKKLEARAAHLESLVTELTQKVSALKLELASQRAPVVLSESMTMKELREEILTLRQQLVALTSPGGGPSNPYILRNKLKEAVKKISQLSLEKQQLIDMGNRLRAELSAAEGNASKEPVSQVIKTPPSKLHPRETQNRLSALEGLQYQLTSQELQFAQYQKFTKDHTTTAARNKMDGDTSVVLGAKQEPPQKQGRGRHRMKMGGYIGGLSTAFQNAIDKLLTVVSATYIRTRAHTAVTSADRSNLRQELISPSCLKDDFLPEAHPIKPNSVLRIPFFRL